MVDIVGFLTGKKPTFAEVQSDVIKRAKNAELSDAQTATLLKTQLEKYGIPLKKGMKGYKPNKRKQTGMADRKKKLSKGGMPKKYNQGGYANCGASVAGTQKK